MSRFNGSSGIGPLDLGARFGAATVLSPYQTRVQAEGAPISTPAGSSQRLSGYNQLEEECGK